MTYTLKDGIGKLEPFLRDEVKYPGLTKNYSASKKAKHIQEWLYFHGFHLEIDGKFGNVTESKVRAFQSSRGLSDTGEVDKATHEALVAPLIEILTPPQSSS